MFFAPGKFDDWCVYLTRAGGRYSAPLDVDYFKFFQDLARRYSKGQVYDDFMTIYDGTDKKVSRKILRTIGKIRDGYKSEDKLNVHKNFVIIYGGMIAEQNKDGAVLGKKIKRIGFYQSVVLGWEAEKAANFSKGKKAGELLGYFSALESGSRPE